MDSRLRGNDGSLGRRKNSSFPRARGNPVNPPRLSPFRYTPTLLIPSPPL